MRRDRPFEVSRFALGGSYKEDAPSELRNTIIDSVQNPARNRIPNPFEIIAYLANEAPIKVLSHAINIFSEEQGGATHFHGTQHSGIQLVSWIAGFLRAGFREPLAREPTKHDIDGTAVLQHLLKTIGSNIYYGGIAVEIGSQTTNCRWIIVDSASYMVAVFCKW